MLVAGYHVEIYNPTNHSEMGVDAKTGILWVLTLVGRTLGTHTYTVARCACFARRCMLRRVAPRLARRTSEFATQAPFCMYNPEPQPDVFIAWRHSYPPRCAALLGGGC